MTLLYANAPHANYPPRDTATDKGEEILSSATGAAAANIALWTGYTGPNGVVGAPAGKVWVEFEALSNVAYIRLKRTSSAAATTTSNGAILAVGVPRVFYLDPSKDVVADVIAGGVGVLKWRVVSQVGERIRH